MFFRRVFSRKSSSSVDSDHRFTDEANKNDVPPIPTSPHRLQRRQLSDDKNGFSVLQLTPLWEHIIRTKALPSHINETEMFSEFLERLYDPEWQVRQHALKVLVDVLIVMSSRADQYFSPLVKPLVENLAHAAPAVQKGALDCLKVYMSETEMPETVLLEIIGIGMEQKLLNSNVLSRQCVSVMLSLPSLVQTQLLNKTKRSFIIKAAIDALTSKMAQTTYQETALKVLLRIREIIGSRDFAEHIAHGDHREFELLCNVYGLPGYIRIRESKTEFYNSSDSEPYSSWQVLSPDIVTKVKMRPSEIYWKSTTEDEADESDFTTDAANHLNYLKKANSCPNVHSSEEKVIMEAEINIENTPVTMRILEEKSCEESILDDNDEYLNSVLEHSGIIRVMTDSELDEINNSEYYAPPRSRTPRRVTFGGESIKLRTPDSDSVNQSDSDLKYKTNSMESESTVVSEVLHIDIPLDNTKESSPKRAKSAAIYRSDSSPNLHSPMERAKSARHRRLSMSPVDVVSPRTPHKEIEVLHNLQRSPLISPDRHKRNSIDADKQMEIKVEDDQARVHNTGNNQSEQKSWEDLPFVDEETIANLKSGDWRLRSRAICQIEEALKSTENLALIQPHLDSFLRTLLSPDDKNIMEDKCRVLVNLISRLPLDNLENRTDQIIIGLCKQGGAESNHIAKSLLQRLPPTVVVHKLLSDDFLNTRSARFRENALQIVLFALMTFPSTCFDISMCVSRAIQAAVDRKRRVRQAALDVLAVLGQISSPKNVLEIVHQNTVNREDGAQLLSAVKARLARKQLPIISPNGNVQYALRIPSPDSNNLMYLFGADIEWINAGVGYVSPLSLKRRSTRLQRPQNHKDSDNDFFRNTTMEDTINKQRHKAPHEILAVGVGVKPPYDCNSIGNIGGYTKATTDDDKNTHFIIGTSIPSSHIPIQFNGNKVKFQGKAFPDQLDGTLNGRESLRDHFDNNGNKSSKLPVTSRFPAMENQYEVRNGKLTNRNYSNFQYNNNFSSKNGTNRYTYTNSSQESPSDLSSTEEYRPATYPTTSPLVRQRFANINKYLHKKANVSGVQNRIKTEEHVTPQTQHFSAVSSPSDRTNSTILLDRTDDPDEEIVCDEYPIDSISNKTHNESRISAHSNASSKKSIDPECDLEESSPVTVVLVDETYQKSQINSRPISVASVATTKSFGDDIENRPSTRVSKSNVSSASSRSAENKSRATLVAEESIRPVSSTSIATSNVVANEEDIENDTEAGHVDDENVNEPVHEVYLNVDSEIAAEGEVVPAIVDEIEVEKETANEIENFDAEHQKDDCFEEKEEITALHMDLPDENIEIIDTQPQLINSDNESNSTNQAIDEVDFAREPTDEHTTSTLSSVQNTGFRHRFRKRKERKVSPAKTVNQINSKSKMKDQHIVCLQQLDSTNWDQIMVGLQTFVCLMRNNPEQIEPQLHQYCLLLSKNIKNLRSQVSRASCQAAGEFFESHSKLLEQEADDLALALLNRTADTNKFLRSDATKALKIMCETLPIPKVIQIVTSKGATHQNAIVRTASANLCTQIIARCGTDKIFSMNRDLRDKLIVTGANLLMEGSLDTRNYAKLFFKQLSHHPNYHKTLQDVIPSRTYRNIEKTLKSIS